MKKDLLESENLLKEAREDERQYVETFELKKELLEIWKLYNVNGEKK